MMESQLGGKRELWGSIVFWVYVMMIIVAVITFVNAVCGILKMKIFLFIFAFLCLLTLFVTLVLAGLLLHDFRESTEKNNYSFGRDILDRTHEDWARDNYCESKYASSGCQKTDYKRKWEGNGAMTALNPNCFSKAQRWYYFKYFRFSYFVMLALVFLFMAALANILLTDESHELTISPIVFGVIGLMLLIGLIFACFFIWTFNHSDEHLYDSFHDNKESAFRPVPESLGETQFTRDNCGDFGDMGLWRLKDDGYYRVSILGQGLKFGPVTGANEGAAESRKLFFQDENSNNDYKFVFGTRDQVMEALNKMDVCVKGMNQANKIYLSATKVANASALNSDGMLQGEVLPQMTLSPNGSQFNQHFPYQYELSCKSVCNQLYEIKQPGNHIAVKGTMTVRNS